MQIFLEEHRQTLRTLPAENVVEALAVAKRHNLCAEVGFQTLPLVFAPDGEFVGSTSCLKRLHFGGVVYGFAANQFSQEQKKEIKQIISQRLGQGNERMSWCQFREAKGADFDEMKKGEVGVKLFMLSPKSMDDYLNETRPPNADEIRGMSFTVMDRWKPEIYFNGGNWNNLGGCVAHFGDDMGGYHAYVVMHEMYHAIGFQHHIEPESVEGKWSADRPLNVMCQQTRKVFQSLGTLVSSQSST